MTTRVADLAQVLAGLTTPVAVADARDWTVLYENTAFQRHFSPPESPDGPLTARMPALDPERALARLAEGRGLSFECEVRTGARVRSFQIELRADEIAGGSRVLVEAHDVSKQKQAEYMLDSYARMAEKHARDLEKSQQRAEKLLMNIMPRTVYEEMKDLGTTTPQRFESASVLMLDFVDFTEMAIAGDPGAVVSELNDIFSAFDRIVDMFGCERLKTMGDAYVAMAGIPDANPEHANNLAKVALRMRRYLDRRNASHPTKWRGRIGIATGPLIGSLVGVQKYVYDVFGPAANFAARLEAMAQPGQILVAEETQRALRDDFILAEREIVVVKGFGEQRVFALEDEVARRG